MKIIDNKNDILHEDLKQEIKKGSKLSIIAALLSEISGMEDLEQYLNEAGLSMNAIVRIMSDKSPAKPSKGKKQLNRQMKMNGEIKQLKDSSNLRSSRKRYAQFCADLVSPPH